eukprot:COSAG06_NODE_1652_length_8798_cov_6.868835_5_plen_179_part_00
MDPFNFPAVGDPRAVGSKFGSSSGTSTDIIFPVSKQIDEAFQPGRTLELAWKSDQHRFWSPKNTRLFVEYELMYGEVDDTCADVATGPVDGAGAPPSRSLRISSGARCGSRGPFHMFNIQNRTGTLSSDLQVRGSLSMIPNVDAKQFLVVMAISESMFDISYQKPSPVPVVTRVMPLS